MIRSALHPLALALAIAGPGGCGAKPDRPAVYRIKTTAYEVEFDGQQKRATIGLEDFLIVRVPEDIRVVDRLLRVGPRDYGPVVPADRISVVGGKVLINGRERGPTGP